MIGKGLREPMSQTGVFNVFVTVFFWYFNWNEKCNNNLNIPWNFQWLQRMRLPFWCGWCADGPNWIVHTYSFQSLNIAWRRADWGVIERARNDKEREREQLERERCVPNITYNCADLLVWLLFFFDNDNGIGMQNEAAQTENRAEKVRVAEGEMDVSIEGIIHACKKR